MKATINDALLVYKQELIDYLEWFEPLKQNLTKLLGREPNGEDIESYFDKPDHRKCMEWSKKLSGMEQVLGMTKEETEQFLQEALNELKK